MNDADYYEKLKNDAESFYKNIGRVSCPVLKNEYVEFTSTGFKHLLQKGRIPRTRSDQIRRFHLLKYAKQILINSNSTVTIRQEKTAHFWEISNRHDNKIIKVIVRQIILKRKGSKHFFSIISEKEK